MTDATASRLVMDPADRDKLRDAKPEAIADLLSAGLAGREEAEQTAETVSDSVPRALSGPAPDIPGYAIVRELHHGGQGLIYEAVQKSTNRKVAIKVILHGQFATKTAQKRFEREIELVAQLEHPNIITIFDSGVSGDGMRYYVMDYVHGVPLHRHVRENDLSLEETLHLFVTVCGAVQYAHQRGVIHRDLKPSNILVDAERRPRVLDFGLARMVTAPVETLVSMSQEVIGTLPYLSPEQARGNSDEIDTRSDVYALGVILYELLTGRYPYPVEGPIPEVLRQIAESPPSPPTRKWTSDTEVTSHRTRRHVREKCPIDPEVQTIVLKALDKERDRRYQSAGEFARDVRRYLAGEPIEAKHDSTWYLLKKTVRRHRVGVTAGLAVLASMAVALGVSVVFWQRAATERERLRQLAYYKQIGTAQAAYSFNQIARMKELLAGCPEDLRGWEWYHLLWLSDRSLRTFYGHEKGFRHGGTAGVRSAVFTSDGQRIISGGQDKAIRIWDVDTAQELLKPLEGNEDIVMSVALSPDQKRIASGGLDKTVRVWDAATGNQILPPMYGHEREVGAVDFSMDGTLIASGGYEGTVIIWDAATGALIRSWKAHPSRVYAVRFNPCRASVASASKDGSIRLWDAHKGTLERTLSGHCDEVKAVAFSPDGRRLVSAGRDRTLILWDVWTGGQLRTFAGHSSEIGAVAFSPNGRWIVSGAADRTVRIWDVESGAELRTLRGHEFPPTSVSFSPDSRLILSAAEDSTLKLWDPKLEERDLSTEGIEGAACPVAFSPDGRLIVSGGEQGVLKIINAATGDVEHTLTRDDYSAISVDFSPNGRLIATGNSDGTVRLWDSATGADLRTLAGHSGAVYSLAFSPDGRWIVSGSADETLHMWHVSSGEHRLTLKGHMDSVEAVAFFPDQKRIVSGGRNGVLKIWDIDDGQCLNTFIAHKTALGEPRSVMSVFVAPDGRTIATSGADNAVRLWDVNTGRPIWTMEGHEYDVRDLTYSPDGTRIASSSADGTVRIWDPNTGQEAIVLSLTMNAGQCVAFSPDGRRLVSGAYPNRLIIWDSRPRE